MTSIRTKRFRILFNLMISLSLILIYLRYLSKYIFINKKKFIAPDSYGAKIYRKNLYLSVPRISESIMVEIFHIQLLIRISVEKVVILPADSSNNGYITPLSRPGLESHCII